MKTAAISSVCVAMTIGSAVSAFPIYHGDGFTIPDNNPAGASSTIFVPDFTIVGYVRVTLVGLTHTWGGDLTATLSNGMQTVDLFRRVGRVNGAGFGTSANFGGDYTFVDGFTGTLWDGADGLGTDQVIPSGQYSASGINGTPVSLGSSFFGFPTAGAWTLTISDSALLDTGSLGSWQLQLVFPTPGASAMLLLAGGVAMRRRRVTG